MKVCFPKKQVQPLRDKSELNDDVAEFVYRNLKQLTVRTDLTAQANVVDEVEAEDWAEATFFGQFNVHYSPKVKRLYHTVILMPKTARRNLILKSNPALPLFEYDVRSCHPVTLLALIDDPQEKDEFKRLLDSDIYRTVAKKSGVKATREDIKLAFVQFVNGSVQNYFHAYFSKIFPKLTEYMMAHGEGMAWFGQTVEAGIMVDEVPRQLLKLKAVNSVLVQNQSNLSLTSRGNPDAVFFVPMHDGWLGIERDEKQIASIVTEQFQKHLGYDVTITKTALATGKETVLCGPRTRKPRPKKSATGKGMDENAKILRRSFRLMTTEQIKKAAKRIFKTNRFGEAVVDMKTLELLRTQGYKMRLAKELEEGGEKPKTE